MSKRVLLCDDEIHIVRAAEFKLVRAGYEVRCAHDGQEAWEIMQDWRPDLLITDCQMPRMTGLELSARLREHTATRDVPILMLTAKGLELSHRDMAEKWGVLAVLSKPFSPRELLRIIEQVLETGTVAPAAQT